MAEADRPTYEQARSMGFANEKCLVELSPLAFRLLKAWMTTKDEAVLERFRWAPAETAKGWERVAAAAQEHCLETVHKL